MESLADAVSVSQPVARPLGIGAQTWVKRIIAGNPFYLVSAGLLLYGINQLTTDPKLVGVEFSMLRFNFCALVIYEVMLVTTSIALARRGIWYDALLLVGLANLFIIVPFSLISRAVYLSPGLALAMCFSGTLLAAGKFWALAVARHEPLAESGMVTKTFASLHLCAFALKSGRIVMPELPAVARAQLRQAVGLWIRGLMGHRCDGSVRSRLTPVTLVGWPVTRDWHWFS